jgi:hypothetical protein
MNMQDFNKKIFFCWCRYAKTPTKATKIVTLLGFCVLTFLFSGCQQGDNYYVYEVETLSLNQEAASKTRLKNSSKFIATAYSDIFGVAISPIKLDEISLTYESFGDSKIIEDMVIRNFLNERNTQIPTSILMRSDTEKFVKETYQRFFTRQPTALEVYKWKSAIESNPNLSSELVYYGFLTSDEYRYY